MLGGIGATELIIVFVILFFLFGGKKLIELARGLGETTKEIKKVQRELSGEEKQEEKSAPDKTKGGDE